MNSDLLNLLDSILGLHKTHANNEYYWHCPFCNHKNKKFAINLSNYKWHCWVCMSAGNSLISLFKKLDCSKEQKKQLFVLLKEEFPNTIAVNDPIIDMHLPQEAIPLWERNKTLVYNHAISYLKNRNITELDIKRYQLYYCDSGLYANRILIPSFDKDLKLNYFVGRSFYEDGMKYKNPPISKNIILFESLVSFELPIVLCEGVFDAIAIRHNAIPLLGKQISKVLFNKLMNSRIPSIKIALDKDAFKNALYYAEIFLNNNKPVHIIELNKKDPSEIGFHGMKQLLDNSKELTFSELIKYKVIL